MLIDPDAPLFRPLAVRLIAVTVPLLAAAYGFATGHIAVSVALGLAGGWLFNRLFLSAARR